MSELVTQCRGRVIADAEVIKLDTIVDHFLLDYLILWAFDFLAFIILGNTEFVLYKLTKMALLLFFVFVIQFIKPFPSSESK